MSDLNSLLFKKMYLSLFNQVTKALELIKQNNCSEAYELLCSAQLNCEEIYISSDSSYA